MPHEREERLRKIIEKYAKMYMKYACQNGVPYDDAEDVVMDAFWSYYRKNYGDDATKSEEENEKSLKALLAKIVYNKCVDYHRRNGKLKTISLDEDVNESEIPDRYLVGNLEEEVLVNMEISEVRKRIKGMNAIWSEAALMYFIEGYSYAEICASLGITGAACRSRITRARKYLKDLLQDYL